MTTIHKATFESANYLFEAYGLTEMDARDNLIAGLAKHAKACHIKANWFEEFADDFRFEQINPAMPNCIRDRNRDLLEGAGRSAGPLTNRIQAIMRRIVRMADPYLDESEAAFTVNDPSTRRRFEILRSERLDKQGAASNQFLLSEPRPTGRVLLFNKDGACTGSVEHPALVEALTTLGPNAFWHRFDEIAKEDPRLTDASMTGAGHGRNTIYLDSLMDCASAIAAALDFDVWHSHEKTPEPPAPSEEREDLLDSLSHAEAARDTLARHRQTQPGLFCGLHNMHGELSGETKNAILRYLNAPSQEGWCAIRGTLILPNTSLWNAWAALDGRATQEPGAFAPSDRLKEAIPLAVASYASRLDAKIQDLHGQIDALGLRDVSNNKTPGVSFS